MSGMTKAERLKEMTRLYIQRAFSDVEMAQKLGVYIPTDFDTRLQSSFCEMGETSIRCNAFWGMPPSTW